MGLAAKRDALFAGDAVNVTEGRAAEHSAERGEGAPESVARARTLPCADARADRCDRSRGARAGPPRSSTSASADRRWAPTCWSTRWGATWTATRSRSSRTSTAWRSRMRSTGSIRRRPCSRSPPRPSPPPRRCSTPKARSPGWREGGVEDPYGRVIALTAAPDKAVEWGVDETRVLPFSESVGGRYSLWSSIGFPAALALGWDAFEELLEGAAEMDRHFRLSSLDKNAPVLAAFADLYYAQARGCETRAVFAYDERLRLLPSYLQQLEMESNGKRVTAEGEAVSLADRADHLGRGRHRRAARGVPAAPSGHAPRARRVRRGDRAGRRARRGASPPVAAQCLRAGRRIDGRARQ